MLENFTKKLFIVATLIFSLAYQNADAQIQLELQKDAIEGPFIIDGSTMIFNMDGYSNDFFISEDGGDTWVEYESGNGGRASFYKFKDHYYAFSPGKFSPLFKSGNDLTEWNPVLGFEEEAGTDGVSTFFSNGEILVLRSEGAIYTKPTYFFSTDGDNWENIELELYSNKNLTAVGFSGDSLIAPKNDPDGWSLWASPDTGTTWRKFAHHDSTFIINKVITTSGKVYGEIHDRPNTYLFKYDMLDKSWTRIFVGGGAFDFDAVGDIVAVTNSENKVHISLDGGESWKAYEGDEGTTTMSDPQIIGSKVYVIGSWPFAPPSATPVHGLYSVDTSGPSTSIEENFSETPEIFSLSQNYPNPFNPTTEITFNISQSQYVELSVFNLLGQKIKTLINRPMATGRHHISFDASSLNSGIYIYRLRAGSFTATKKMTLIK